VGELVPPLAVLNLSNPEADAGQGIVDEPEEFVLVEAPVEARFDVAVSLNGECKLEGAIIESEDVEEVVDAGVVSPGAQEAAVGVFFDESAEGLVGGAFEVVLQALELGLSEEHILPVV